MLSTHTMTFISATWGTLYVHTFLKYKGTITCSLQGDKPDLELIRQKAETLHSRLTPAVLFARCPQ